MTTSFNDPVVAPSKPRLLKFLGPGLITGAFDDDPSGITTYSQVGAQFGFSISWTMLFTYPLMAAIQEISGRIGRTAWSWYSRECPEAFSCLGFILARSCMC